MEFLFFLVAWLVFGWFAARMALIESADSGINTSLGGCAFALGGPITWAGAMASCKRDSRYIAHFLPVPVDKPNSKYKSILFAVKNPQPDKDQYIAQLEEEAGIGVQG